MMTLIDIAPRIGKAHAEEKTFRYDNSDIYRYLSNLESTFTNNEFDYIIPLGDNWLGAWNWALDLEKRHSIDHQRALKVAYRVYFERHNNER